MTSAAGKNQTIPERPRLVLRVGFAGDQRLSKEDKARFEPALTAIFGTIARKIAKIAPASPLRARHSAPQFSDFYSPSNPRLRLVTGLCQGADLMAGSILTSFAISKENPAGYVELELAAILPFSVEEYRSGRDPDWFPEFDRQIESCSYVVELDGIYEKPTPDTDLARNRRNRGYRGQSAVLLRHSDIIIALADPKQSNLPGGTMGTVRAALNFDLPVVFLHANNGAVSVIDSTDDPIAALEFLEKSQINWEERLEDCIEQILTGRIRRFEPVDSGIAEREEEKKSLELLEEFFGDKNPSAGKSWGEFCWTTLLKWCTPEEKPKSDIPLTPYKIWRERSTNLNGIYAGRYRGAFILNYLLAAIAVGIAATSLVLLMQEESFALRLVLIGMACAKILILVAILINTLWANDRKWNDRAVDFRYLAERLRSMYYLPIVGSARPPSALPTHHTSRVIHKSAVDWLFNAIVRSVSPAEVNDPGNERVKVIRRKMRVPEKATDGAQKEITVTSIRPEPRVAIEAIRDGWIANQAFYHHRQAFVMGGVLRFVERWGRLLSITVIVFVLFDLVLTSLAAFGFDVPVAVIIPGLVAFAAFAPAAVASLNGIRFQSECQRLADRSLFMRTRLKGIYQENEEKGAFAILFPGFCRKTLSMPPGKPVACLWADADALAYDIERANADQSNNPGSWIPQVLHVTEEVAAVMIEEVAEWSVLYAKEVIEV